MEIKATYRFPTENLQKVRGDVRRSIHDIQGMVASKALIRLDIGGRRSSLPLRNALAQAIARAKAQNHMDISSLVVREVVVEQEPMVRRLKAHTRLSRTRGLRRVSHSNRTRTFKRASYIKILLSDEVAVKVGVSGGSRAPISRYESDREFLASTATETAKSLRVKTIRRMKEIELPLRLVDRAVDVLGSEESAQKWLHERNRVLGGKTPAEVAASEGGIREVENILGRIEHGVFS